MKKTMIVLAACLFLTTGCSTTAQNEERGSISFLPFLSTLSENLNETKILLKEQEEAVEIQPEITDSQQEEIEKEEEKVSQSEEPKEITVVAAQEAEKQVVPENSQAAPEEEKNTTPIPPTVQTADPTPQPKEPEPEAEAPVETKACPNGHYPDLDCSTRLDVANFSKLFSVADYGSAEAAFNACDADGQATDEFNGQVVRAYGCSQQTRNDYQIWGYGIYYVNGDGKIIE